MIAEDLFQRLAVALAIGLLVGLERGWQLREEAEGSRAAGLRTFALTGLLGGFAGVLASLTAPVTLGLIGLAFATAFTVFHVLESRRDGSVSATGVVAGLLTFSLGAYAVLGRVDVAVAGAVAMTLLLALKEPLHRWVARLSWAEIRAVLTLLAMSFLLLPVLPDRPIDPWGALNPAEIWLFAIMIAGMSFVGYVAVRLFGERNGVALAGIAGGLASSTATTLTLARLGRETPQAAPLLAAGILFAAAVMATRVVIIATIVDGRLLAALGPALGAGALVFTGAAILFMLPAKAAETEPRLALDNPFELGTALKFAALIAVVMLLAAATTRFAGDAGLYALAAASGLADVDAITLSVARMARGDIALATAARAIALAVAVNSLVKVGLVFGAGAPAVGVRVAAATLAAFAAAAAALVLVPAG